MIACRWVAIAIGLTAILDPAIGVPRTERPPIDLAVFASPARADAAAQTGAGSRARPRSGGISRK